MQSFVRLQKLTDLTQADLAATFRRVAEILSTTRERQPLQLQFSLFQGEAEEPLVWCVVGSKDGYNATQKRSERPDVEVITRAETWREIAEGRLSPLEAFVKGRLRVRGNLEMAKRIFLVDLASGPAQLPDWAR